MQTVQFTSPNRRAIVFIACAAAIVCLGGTLAAQEGDIEEVFVEVGFYGFSSNRQFFAYQTRNHLDQRMLVVGQVNSPEPAYTQAADEDHSPRDILISRELRDVYGWSASGEEGVTSPSGYTELRTSETGANLTISAVQNGLPAPIGTIARMTNDAYTAYADYEVKQVLWAPEEQVVVVIVEQRLPGEWPMRVQTAHGFMVPARPTPPPPAPPPGQ